MGGRSCKDLKAICNSRSCGFLLGQGVVCVSVMFCVRVSLRVRTVRLPYGSYHPTAASMMASRRRAAVGKIGVVPPCHDLSAVCSPDLVGRGYRVYTYLVTLVAIQFGSLVLVTVLRCVRALLSSLPSSSLAPCVFPWQRRSL